MLLLLALACSLGFSTTLLRTFRRSGRGVLSHLVKVTGYEYDAIGQLIRVNDETDTTAGTSGTTWVFTYDLGGNILTKAAYPYTTGTVGTVTESHTYIYGNTGWKDQLTAIDGTPITYDAISNPLNDGTWTYTWQHGKQLAQMSRIGGNETISFEYNEDGLRTKKTSTVTGITEYNEGLQPVGNDEGKWGYMNTHGEMTIQFAYDRAEPFFDGLALVEKDGKLMYIDHSAAVVWEER